jgi:D-alanine-D-alanine ligase
MKNPLHIAVVYSLPTKRALGSPYADTEQDTVDSAEEVFAALKEKGAQPLLVPIDEESIAAISKIRADCIVNLIDWTGLDLPLSDVAFTAIEHTGIPFTGATRENYLTTSDKILMKKALDMNRLPTACWQLFEIGTEPVRPDFTYPVIVKLAFEHCSIGLTHDAIVATPRELAVRATERIKTFGEPVIAEEFIIGREFQVTAIETPDGVLILPPAEIIFVTQGTESLLTFDSRWNETTADYASSHVGLPTLSADFAGRIASVAKKTFKELGFRDYARLDIRTREDTVYILEANSNPGLSDSDEYGMTVSYKAGGMTFADFVWTIVNSSMRRFTAPAIAALRR